MYLAVTVVNKQRAVYNANIMPTVLLSDTHSTESSTPSCNFTRSQNILTCPKFICKIKIIQI